jgi:hypothetical protein
MQIRPDADVTRQFDEALGKVPVQLGQLAGSILRVPLLGMQLATQMLTVPLLGFQIATGMIGQTVNRLDAVVETQARVRRNDGRDEREYARRFGDMLEREEEEQEEEPPARPYRREGVTTSHVRAAATEAR